MTNQWVTSNFPTVNKQDFWGLFDDLLGPPPQKEIAAPAGTGNGDKIDSEATKLHGQNYPITYAVPSDFDDLLGSDSPLDLPVAVTRFPTQSAQSKTERVLSMRQLASEIGQASADDKAGLPWFKLATFGDHRSEKNCLRNNANVLAVSGVEADYDAGIISPDEAEARLRAAGVAAMVYTSPSHGQDGKGNRFRVFAPFDGLLPPGERERHMARLNGIFDGTLDGASFVLSQSYYGGSIRGRAPVDIRLIDGIAINRADALDATALDKNARRAIDESKGIDTSGSGALYRLAAKIKRNSGDKADFEAAISDHAASAAHVAKEEGAGQGRGQRAIDRAWARAPEPESLEDIFEDQPRKKVEPSRLSFLSPGECADTPSRGYVIKGLLAPQEVACIFGAPGAGKSLIAPYLGYRVARGEAAFGMRTKQGSVFYVAAEDPYGLRGRVSALRLTHRDADGFTLVEGVSDLLSKDAPDLKALLLAVAERKPALIVLDTLAVSFPGLEENTAEGMGRVVAVAKQLTKHGAAVIMVHHDTKAEGGTPRGHSLLNGALDMAMHVTRDDQGIVRGKLTKIKNGSPDRDLAFRIGVVEMGEDEDGDPITFAIAKELSPGMTPKLEKLTAAENAALDILRDMTGHVRDKSQAVPDLLEEIPESEWRNACLESAAVSASDNPESKRKAIYRAIVGLARKHRINVSDGRVRISSDEPSIEDEFEDSGDDLRH